MQQGFRTEVKYLLLLLVLLTLFGLNTGYLLSTWLVGLAGYLFWSFVRLRKLELWLGTGIDTPPPYIPGAFGIIAENCHRIENRHQKLLDLQKERITRISKLANALSEGVIILKDGIDLDWWNPSAETLLKFRKDDRGNPVYNLLRNPRFVNFVQRQDFDKPLEMPSPNNATQILLFTGAIFDHGDVVLLVRDVTRLRRLEQMRKDFVANISHELRTPLTVLTGYIETLQDSAGQMPDTWKKALLQMEQQSERMNHLANDLVTLSQLESADNVLPTTTVVLFPLLSQVRQDAEAFSNGAYTITLESTDPELAILGNPKELYSAFSNLVLNAVRHNPPGTCIDIRCLKSKENEIRVDIEDNGTGIDPIHIPRLTERFYRVDNSRNSGSGGTGLGLAIVKHVLLHHHGSLQIRSTLTKGTTFSCLFKQTETP